MTLDITSPSEPDFRISLPPGTELPPRFGLSVAETLSLEVEIGTAGAQGPPGAGGDSYTHTQASAASVWTVNHNLARSPAGVSAWTAGGVEIEGAVLVISPNQITISFNTPYAGTARVI